MEKSSKSGNWFRVPCLTNRYTDHYTNSEYKYTHYLIYEHYAIFVWNFKNNDSILDKKDMILGNYFIL